MGNRIYSIIAASWQVSNRNSGQNFKSGSLEIEVEMMATQHTGVTQGSGYI